MNSGLTIFYTDDDQEDLEFFKEIVDLIDENVEVVTHHNGQELINALNNAPVSPHCMFLDINMPGMNGLDILQKIRNSTKYKDLPVIMFSTAGDAASIARCKELGANLYVQKSGTFDQFKSSVEHAIKMNWSTFTANEKNFVFSI